MDIHEYQAKQLLKKYNLPILKGNVAFNNLEAIKVAKELDEESLVLKAQVKLNDRKRLGGIIFVNNINNISDSINFILSKKFINPKNIMDEQVANCVYIEENCKIKREFYLSIFINRKRNNITIIISNRGGVNIESVLKENPKSVLILNINPIFGIKNSHLNQLGSFLNIKNKSIIEEFELIIKTIYSIFLEKNATLIELNPLALDLNGKLKIIDAKISLDENSLFRHREFINFKYNYLKNSNLNSNLDSNYDFDYIKMDGNVGSMANGAGLAMATIDLIRLYNGRPANFLDIGGSAIQKKIELGFRIILDNLNIKSVLINIFGGILHCDIVSNSIINVISKEKNTSIPIVIRLQGTNSDIGEKILVNSGFPIFFEQDLDKAALKAINFANF